MVRPAPTDIAAYRRVRRTARWATAGVAILAAYLTLVMVLGADQPAAIIPYLMLCGLGFAGFWVLRALWRRTAQARPLDLLDDAGPGARRGVPELDAEPAPHLGLTGEVDPPTRW